jgi:hypothetical protein
MTLTMVNTSANKYNSYHLFKMLYVAASGCYHQGVSEQRSLRPARCSQYFTVSAEMYKMSEILKYIKNVLVHKLIEVLVKYQPRLNNQSISPKVQSPFEGGGGGSSSSSASQEIINSILRNQKVHYRFHNSPPLVHIFKPAQSRPSPLILSKSHFTVTSPSMPTLSKWAFSFGLPNKNHPWIYFLIRATCIANPILNFYLPNNVC